LDLEGTGRFFTAGDTEGIRTTAQQVAGSEEFYVFAGFRQKTAEFIEAVRTRVPPPSHFGDALQTVRIAESILHRSVVIEA
ncbi:MAG: hypothetical protein J2P23_09260, partial [Microlunatus sp.]|nr:hypothetical protein [Microlunatus sp.]